MIQASVKQKYTIIALVFITLLVFSSIIALVEYNQMTYSRINVVTQTKQLKVIQGSNGQIQVEVNSIGKAENVTLSSNVGSSGIDCSFGTVTGISNFSSTLTIKVPISVSAGNYSIILSAESKASKENNASLIVIVLPSSAGITVSGKANSAPLSVFPTILSEIKFADTETGTTTSFSFSYPSPPMIDSVGTYSVVLMKQHTYNVTISYFTGPTLSNMSQYSDYVGNFTVGSSGTTIIKNFGTY